MKAKKLEKKLNKLSKYYEVIVKETSLKDELAVCIRERGKEEMWIPIFYLTPPHEVAAHRQVKSWTLGTRINFWTAEGLKFYIESLNLAEKFLSSKEK